MSENLMSPPLLSSENAGWTSLKLEHHIQTAHEAPELVFPHHIIEVGLRYDAAELKVNGCTYRQFLPGNIAIHPANEPICIESYGEAEFIAIAINSALLTTLIDADLSAVELIPQLFGQDPLILNMALALKQVLETQASGSQLYAESMTTALAAHLMQHYATTTAVVKTDSGGLSARQLKLAIAYIHAHLHQPLSLATMAATVHLSSHHFASLFKRSTGVAPYQYVVRCRIEKAKRLLANSDLSIIEICGRIGFTSQSHFTKVFREYTQHTPKAYRQLL